MKAAYQSEKEKEDDIKISGGFQNHLELRLGISLNSSCPQGSGSPAANQSNGLGPKWWFPAPVDGFMHPWSLAARQVQKAVFEKKAHHNPNSSFTVPSRAHPFPLPPPVVGWPPVRPFRKSLVVPKAQMEGEKDAKRAKTAVEGPETSKGVHEEAPSTAAMQYVKVNMEGYAVGRKINLKAHDSYDSLSLTLQKMFNNFLSYNFSNNSEQVEEDDAPSPGYLLIYEDYEGDRMLVGDVPWEIFIGSVKRLYIAHSPRSQANVDGRAGQISRNALRENVKGDGGKMA